MNSKRTWVLVVGWCIWAVNVAVYFNLLFRLIKPHTMSPVLAVAAAVWGSVSLGMVGSFTSVLLPRVRAYFHS
jgi:hypothetical protein